MYDIRFIPKEQLDSILPLLELLNPGTALDVLVQRLEEIKKTDYQCVGVYDGTRLIAISGIWILNKIYAGKHIEPDNVVVHPDYRNKRVGEQLLDWIHEYGIHIGCRTSELNARMANEKGVKFWRRMGYEPVGYHFIRPLGDRSEDSAKNSCLE